MRACVRACMRACVRACVRACMHTYMHTRNGYLVLSLCLTKNTFVITLYYIYVLVTDPQCPGCIRFSYTTNVYTGNISYLNLWVYQQATNGQGSKRNDIKVHKIQDVSKEFILKQRVRRAKSGWVNIKINDIYKWITSTVDGHLKVELLLQLTCTHCSILLDGPNLPMLDISDEMMIKKRKRRSLKCSAREGECCLDSFYVEFKDFMGDFAKLIIWPEGEDIGHCRGSCEMGNPISREHAAILKAAKSKMSEDMQLCCVPQKFKSFSVLVYNRKVELIKKDIFDLVVAECGCA